MTSIASIMESDARTQGARRPPEMSFPRLIAPVSPQQFFDEHWERRPLLIQRSDAFYYGSLFSIEDVDRYMACSRPAAKRVSIVPPPGSGGTSRRTDLESISMDALYASFCSGQTIRLESIQETWAPVAALIASIEEALGASLNVNLYLSPPRTQGLRSHFDTHDVFVLQVEGSKEWRVWDVDSRLPVETPSYLRHLARSGQDQVREVPERLLHHATLRKGDLLYMPRGFPHKALTTDESSIHLAVAVKPVHWVDLLKTALDIAAIDMEDLRRAIPAGLERIEMDERGLGAMRDRFHELLRACAENSLFEEALGVVQQERLTGRGYPPDGHFAQLADLHTLRPSDDVERRAGLICRVRATGDSASIQFAGNEVRAPAAIRPALEFVCDHRRFRISDISETLSDESKVVLVRRLVREGLLRRADPDEAR